jgi:hypothetical protein
MVQKYSQVRHIIYVDSDVWLKLQELATLQKDTANKVLRRVLGIDR